MYRYTVFFSADFVNIFDVHGKILETTSCRVVEFPVGHHILCKTCVCPVDLGIVGVAAIAKGFPPAQGGHRVRT